MKVTIEGVSFEGTSDEIYEILTKLGYLSKFVQPIKTIRKEDLPSIPATWPNVPVVPYWTQPYTVGDPPPGTYPQVWCGTGGTINYEDMLLDDVSKKDKSDKLGS